MKKFKRRVPSGRQVVLGILGVVTVGVAVLSMAVSYQILDPRFGWWAAPTVGALDALWVVFQATEILAGSNRARARRVQWAGLALTAVNAAIPTADLILTGTGGFDLAVVLTPIAIIATKSAWWIVLPSLGRQMSDKTREAIAAQRQDVADQLEEMEAEASQRIELLTLTAQLNKRVARAETDYRLSVLKAQQTMTEALHEQAEATAKTVAGKVLPPSVAAIRLPELGQWTPAAPALPGTVAIDRHTASTQVSELLKATGTPPGTPAHPEAQVVTLAELAVVAGVPVPVPGEQLTDEQLDVVLRYLRYADHPPISYRQARDAFRRAGYVGGEKRVRQAWGALLANEESSGEEESEDADTDV